MGNQNIALVLADVAGRYPARTGLTVRTRSGEYHSWTFAEMAALAGGFVRELEKRGVKPGDRVMLMVRPSVEFICLAFALFAMGAVVILIDPGMGYRNLLRCIAQVKPAVFIAIPKAHLFKLLFPRPFTTVRVTVCVGFAAGLFGRSLTARSILAAGFDNGEWFAPIQRLASDPAAILFTTGSTGPPKGVRYSHGNFRAQLQLIREHYLIGPDDIDQPAFPLFALFSAGLGACSVIPDMDPARPAAVDPVRFIRTIQDRKVTYSFGSPAIWNVVSQYCLEHGIVLASLTKVLMAGAPVSGELVARVKKIIATGGEVHTPYGATESLPVTSISGSEILDETWAQSRRGMGICVGRPLPGITVRIMRISDQAVADWDPALEQAGGEIGEIIVSGPVVTMAYDNNDAENQMAKIRDRNGFWHRLGDVGYLDDHGRLWFCGRKAHRVVTQDGTLFSVCCEAIFNGHPAVLRTALVGIGMPGVQQPVLVVELRPGSGEPQPVLDQLRVLGARNDLTSAINTYLFHPAFPVDIRHNAKIFREKLAVWAAEKLQKDKS